MIYKYYYTCISTPSLLNIITAHGIKYDFFPPEKQEVSFCISTKNKEFSSIKEEADKNKTFLTVLYEYESHELEQSEWLILRSKCSKIEEYEKKNDTYFFECKWKGIYYEHMNHRQQVAPFRLARMPKWGKSFFSSPVGFFEDLFLNEYAKKVLEENNIRGIDYLPVRIKSKDEYAREIYQMTAQKILPDDALDLSVSGIKQISCPNCGKKQYALEDDDISLSVYANFLTHDVDCYSTNPIFGEELTHKKLIVSKRFYQAICEAKIGRNLFWVPVKLL